MHGFALNVFNGAEGFDLMNPCGFSDISVTSMRREFEEHGLQGPGDIAEVEDRIITQFTRVFNIKGYKEVCKKQLKEELRPH